MRRMLVSADVINPNKGNRKTENETRQQGKPSRRFSSVTPDDDACNFAHCVDLSHACDTVLLVFVLLEHLVLKPLGGFRALCVDVCGPEVSDGVFDDEEDGNGEGPDQPVCRPGNVVFNSFALTILWLLDVVWCSAESVNQAS
jgi:hypothetical protein